ncbi:hypothetical protein [Pedobacter endophyticus]|uniref:Uncharacterized protein n=1 Tax=Pedobacter endophyticus TaxID=2789740 RepID=A0A7U3SPQ3_9SPHI|nr:hypothetical protein [Pedobacter endophyticus]QPH38149.1 hypothetical protein IZT61_13700 [Pedobacter endophyticus]
MSPRLTGAAENGCPNTSYGVHTSFLLMTAFNAVILNVTKDPQAMKRRTPTYHCPKGGGVRQGQ